MYSSETQPECGDFLFVTERKLCTELEEFFTQENLKVARVESGKEALAAIEAEPWTIMVADAQLPDIDGVELTRSALAKRPDMYVVLGDSEPPVIDLCDKAGLAGVMGIVNTPYNPDELFTLLWFVMELRQQF